MMGNKVAVKITKADIEKEKTKELNLKLKLPTKQKLLQATTVLKQL